eukprot:TRINITY_DN3403_c0_g1_i10.p1 TRINITY_DN3403_c0_g1~~TRINITY_DN3403_c0_g1_i10.p1  ORF type:complete len:434 (-),score=87.98 TRINITY_DN3403_c0_g1_i10:216-1517(-)
MSSNLSPLLLPGDYPSLRILPHAPYALDECKLDIYEDIYSNTFVNQRHYNWIATDPTTMTHTVYSILATPESQTETEQIHRVLKTFAKGYHDFLLTVKAGSSKTLPSRLDEALREREKKDLYDVFDNSAFATKFAELEVKHSQKRTQFKMGIIYVKQNQLHPREWFTNGLGDDKLDQRFWEFMKIFGKEIDLLDWSGYLGDMGRKGQTYFDFWKESISIMYHVSPMLDSEGHRRLIGNDIGVLFWVEEGVQFSPQFLNELGTVQQIYVALQPVGNKWRCTFFSNINIKPYGPPAPENLVDIAAIKELVLTSIHNGLVMTNYCPPIHRLFYVPRSETLESIVACFPYVTPKERKAASKVTMSGGGPKLHTIGFLFIFFLFLVFFTSLLPFCHLKNLVGWKKKHVSSVTFPTKKTRKGMYWVQGFLEISWNILFT